MAVFTQRGGGLKACALPRKFVFLGFRREECGMSQEFCRVVPDSHWGWFQKLVQKMGAHFVTRYAPTLNPNAGFGVQRQSARRQPVVQTQILVVQGLLCWNKKTVCLPYLDDDRAHADCRFGSRVKVQKEDCRQHL